MKLTGTTSADLLNGNEDDDFLDGSLGDDSLSGGAGADVLLGGDDDPWSGFEMETGIGNDVLDGGDGDDELDGGYGNDTLIGGAGNDLLDGGDARFIGNDLYDGVVLSVGDWMAGGVGDDTYMVDSVLDVVVENGGEGTDEVRSSVGYTLTGDVERLSLTGEDSLDGTGNGLDNTLTGNGSANRLEGLGGSDLLIGGGGNDSLVGGDGNDTFGAGVGRVTVVGGTGSDVVNVGWSDLTGVTVSTSNLVKDANGYSGAYQAKDTTGAVLASVQFSGIEKLVDGTKVVSIAPASAPGVLIKRVSTAVSTTEQGGVVRYGVALARAPIEPVTIQFTVSDATEGVLTKDSLTFTAQNWSSPQGLEVRGVDDFLDDGNVAYSISGKIVTADLTYNRVAVSVTNLTNLDDTQDRAQQIYGTDETDYKVGANGDDRIYGKGGQDDLRGGRGNDRIYGGEDDDRLFGELGDDLLHGGVDDDTLDGGEGSDSLFGDEGADTLVGGLGGDQMDGGLMGDSMVGGAGNDTYFVDSAGDRIDDRGLATDRDTVIVLQAIKYTLAASIEDATITAVGVADLKGNDLNNGLTGNESRNVLDGGVGNDLVDGGGGADSLLGGVGNDSLVGGSGNDTIRGGEGVDWADFVAAGIDVRIDLATGKATGFDGSDLLLEIENVVSGGGNDQLFGSSGANQLSGGVGRDSLSGGDGNDSLVGCFAGKNGGRGEVDTLTGGKGVDEFVLGWSGGRLYDDGNAIDAGKRDYALITDFTVGQDRLILDGSEKGYLVGASTVTGVAGTGVFADSNANSKLDSTDELMAVVRSSSLATALTRTNLILGARFV